MTEYAQRPSGLVVAVPPPEKPKRILGRAEIRDEPDRTLARKAMLGLWDAMRLSRGGGGILGDNNFDLHYLTYRYVGEMLLGSDCPEKEMRT